MTNDPTTTGAAATGEHGTLTRVARTGFKLELEATFDVVIYADSVWVGFFAGSDEPHEMIQVPLALFESEEQAEQWGLETVEMFKQNWHPAMAFEMARHFNNIGRYHLYEMGRSPYSSIERVITEQVRQTEKNLRQWLHARPTKRGNFSKWNDRELYAYLVSLLTRHPGYTWKELHAALKESNPDRAPKSPDALRQLARRNGLALRNLKKGVTKRRVNA